VAATQAGRGCAAAPLESEQNMVEGTDSGDPRSEPGPVTDGSDALRMADASHPETVRALASAPAPSQPGPPGRDGGDGHRRAGSARNRSGRRERGPFYAALDLGTNNCRLLVAEPSAGGFRVVDSFSRIVRLGEGVAQNGALKADAMDRAVGALRICSQKLGARPVAKARLIATEACRMAANGADFLERVRDELGLDLEIIDRRTEASLAAEGCFSLLDPQAEGAVLFDIGGGSSEIVWLDRRKARRRGSLVRAWVSLPLGVVTLAEKHGGEEVDDIVFERMVEEVQSEFHRFRARDGLKAAVAERAFHYLGTSGTVTTLAGVHLDLPRYDRRYVDGLWMGEEEIQRMMEKIRGMDYEARRSNPCIGHDRADLVLAGCAIFEAIRREWRCSRLRVADRGLREGILVQLMRADGFLRGPGRPPVNG
jgi:exopolyphosphatase / guanosine-5'-triphosphate,3'-diphosphate pyrophosphatase